MSQLEKRVELAFAHARVLAMALVASHAGPHAAVRARIHAAAHAVMHAVALSVVHAKVHAGVDKAAHAMVHARAKEPPRRKPAPERRAARGQEELEWRYYLSAGQARQKSPYQ